MGVKEKTRRYVHDLRDEKKKIAFPSIFFVWRRIGLNKENTTCHDFIYFYHLTIHLKCPIEGKWKKNYIIDDKQLYNFNYKEERKTHILNLFFT